MDGTQRRVAVLGSTGSIGRQTLDTVASYPELFVVSVLTAGSNMDMLSEQAAKFRPSRVVVANPQSRDAFEVFRAEMASMGIKASCGDEAIADAMADDDTDVVVTATVGYSGLIPTIRAIRAGKTIALANKETLVVAGDIVTREKEIFGVDIIPVDSEHSAIYQCLHGEDRNTVERLWITASGGPFRCVEPSRLAGMKASDALRHPNWSMGAKITVDSATMVNKSFEIIEARWLFGIPGERISAVVHPQSIVHSMVEYRDGALKAQLGVPDMHLPIRYALAGSRRLELPSVERRLTVADMSHLTFEEPDVEKFPGIALGHYALQHGGNTACVINAANEIAVDAFLHDRIGFTDIVRIIEKTLERADYVPAPTLDDYVESNTQARCIAAGLI
ncbi:1-deoxy-D-xylulose-5-phosphate reductoisomerase [uncultured Duncaniella sp.]|uniref:1-deoxy-D-xylulose-5-phosphate reductoisomerase n=1 Tax=uncultured Duncaniella sp. TaxID=2768039 RepID=UPI0025B11E2E|nr:1-deoxy-D-xylulose-5-phosphate reductoisomerase [uncultured Duncaniella sp.]